MLTKFDEENLFEIFLTMMHSSSSSLNDDSSAKHRPHSLASTSIALTPHHKEKSDTTKLARVSMMIRAYRFGSLAARRGHTGRRLFSSTPPPPKEPPVQKPQSMSGPASSKTQGIGTGKASAGSYIKDRGPVSWPSLFLVGIAAASIVAYYNIERERRLESAMGRVVSSESEGWTPNPEVMAPRKFKLTPWGWFPEEDAFGPSGKPAIGGPWSLIDLEGNLVTNVSFQGKWLLLYFGFARCPDICPSEMLKIARVLDELKESNPEVAAKIVPVFVSVDPARDSLSALKEYSKDFHPDFVFLTGSPTQVQQMAKKYRVYVSKAEETEDGDYLVDHSIVVYFHDEQGELADCFTQSMRPKDIIEKITERMTTATAAST